MEFSGLTARDMAAPPTLAEDAATFAVPVYGLVAQPSLRFAGHGTTQSNGTTDSISISYSYLAEPGDPNAVVNFVGNIDEIRGYMRKAELDQQPDWFKEGVATAQYPMLWEAVLTALDPDRSRTLDEHLADQVNHLLVNTMDHRRTHDPEHGMVLDHGVRPSHAQSATVSVSGVRTPARVLDTDPDIVGWAVQIDEAIVILGLPRDRANKLDLELGPVGTVDRG